MNRNLKRKSKLSSETLYQSKVLSSDVLINQLNTNLLFGFVVVVILSFYPELCLAADTTMEQQLETVNTLGNDKLKTIGFSIAGICIGLIALIKGSLQIALTSVAIGVIISLMLEWIKGGMVLLG